MRKKRKSEDGGFNVWRSYSDMMAGVLLLFVLIMCVTLFQAQKSYNESIEERDEKIALQEEYTLEILAQQNELNEKEGQLKDQNEQLKTQDEKLKDQETLLSELAAKLKDQEATLSTQKADLDEKTALLKEQQAQIDQIIGVKADVIEALRQEFAKNNINVDIDTQTGALTLEASVLFDYDEAEQKKESRRWSRFFPFTVRFFFRKTTGTIWRKSLLTDTRTQTVITAITSICPSSVRWR